MNRTKVLLFVYFFFILTTSYAYSETNYELKDIDKGFDGKPGSTFSSYVSGRIVLDALKVVAPANLVDNLDGTTPHFGLGAAAGVRQSISIFMLRYEVDYSFSMTTNSYYHSTTLNLYFGIDLPKTPVAPYIMVGVGINVFDPPFANIETNFAYCVGAGVLIYITKDWALDIATRYMETNMNFRLGIGNTKVNNNNVYVGFVKLF